MTLTGNNGGDAMIRLQLSSAFRPARKIAWDFQLSSDQFAENLRDIAPAFPAGVDEDRELFRIQSEHGARRQRALFARNSNFGCTGMPEILIRRGHTVVDQLLSRPLGRHEIKCHIVARPPPRIRNKDR